MNVIGQRVAVGVYATGRYSDCRSSGPWRKRQGCYVLGSNFFLVTT
jgi:hypothetical protein